MDITETSTGTSYTGVDAQNAFAELQKQYGGGEDDDGGKGKGKKQEKSVVTNAMSVEVNMTTDERKKHILRSLLKKQFQC